MKQRWKGMTKWIFNLPVLKQVLGWSKRYSLPGFNGVPLYNIIVFIYKETLRDNITTRANSVAFSLFLAIFPFIIFLFTLLPILFQPSDFADLLHQLLPKSEGITENSTYIEMLQGYMEDFLPQTANVYLLDIIEGIVGRQREGLLSLGFFLAIFFASSGMLTLMYGFDKSNEVTFKDRSYIRMRGIAIMLTILLSVLFIMSFFLLIMGNLILAYLSDLLGVGERGIWVISIFKSLVAFALLYIGITIIYKYGPSLKKRTRFINPGSILATILSIITSLGFSYFVNNFGRYNELYGSIGALIVIMLWFQFNAFVILIGFELNASIAVNRDLLDMKSRD